MNNIFVQGGFVGSRDNFRDNDVAQLKLSSDYSSRSKKSDAVPITQPAAVNFEYGDHFNENEMPKETFKFAVSHIAAVNDFFIQLVSKGDEVSKLTDILQNDYRQAPEVNLNSFKINQSCLAKNSDDCWYRGNYQT